MAKSAEINLGTPH